MRIIILSNCHKYNTHTHTYCKIDFLNFFSKGCFGRCYTCRLFMLIKNPFIPPYFTTFSVTSNWSILIASNNSGITVLLLIMQQMCQSCFYPLLSV